MITRIQLIEAPQPDLLERRIEKFLEQTEQENPALRTARENKTLTVEVARSETIGGWHGKEAMYIAVIRWPDIL